MSEEMNKEASAGNEVRLVVRGTPGGIKISVNGEWTFKEPGPEKLAAASNALREIAGRLER